MQRTPPDLVAEVRPPSTWRYDLLTKRRRYEDWGVGELWLVDPPGQTVFVFRRPRPGAPWGDPLELMPPAKLTGPALRGFELPLVELLKLTP